MRRLYVERDYWIPGYAEGDIGIFSPERNASSAQGSKAAAGTRGGLLARSRRGPTGASSRR